MLFLGLGLIELLFCAVIIIALIVATAFDRRGAESAKWWVTIVGLGVLGWYFAPDYVLWGNPHVDAVVNATTKEVIKPAYDRVVLWDVIFTPAIWVPVGIYLAAGIGYSLFEFFFGIWRAARQYSERWEKFLLNRLSSNDKTETAVIAGFGLEPKATYAEVFRAVQTAEGPNAPLLESIANSCIGRFDTKNTKADFVTVVNDEALTMTPKVLKWKLTQWLTAWTLFWPAYGLSLIFGDLLAELFKAFADLLHSLSGRIVRAAFANVFKF
jgi:hypothetical protein